MVIVIDLSILSIITTLFTLLYFLMWCVLSTAHIIFKDKTFRIIKFNPHQPSVSILLPCRDEEEVVAEAIRQCLNQSYENLEVILVAHNCQDKTFDIAKQFESEKVHVFKLETKETGKGVGLNYGFKFAKGEIIVYFDADSIIKNDYIEKIVEAIYDEKCDIVQGKIVGGNSDYNRLCFLQHMENLIFLSLFWGGKQKIGLPSGLGGTGVAIKRSSLEKLGGFRNFLVEDFDLCLRAELEDMKVEYCKDAIVYDEKVPHWGMLIRQRSRWFAGHFQLINDMMRAPKKFLALLQKNPVDFLHLFSPFYNFCLWVGIFLGVISFVINSLQIFPNVWIVFFSLPMSIFIIETILLQSLFLLVLKKECRTRKELFRCAINLPLFYVFTAHWFIVFWRGLFLRDWKNTKMQHGFRGK